MGAANRLELMEETKTPLQVSVVLNGTGDGFLLKSAGAYDGPGLGGDVNARPMTRDRHVAERLAQCFQREREPKLLFPSNAVSAEIYPGGPALDIFCLHSGLVIETGGRHFAAVPVDSASVAHKVSRCVLRNMLYNVVHRGRLRAEHGLLFLRSDTGTGHVETLGPMPLARMEKGRDEWGLSRNDWGAAHVDFIREPYCGAASVSESQSTVYMYM
ncbi:hypothetical protein C8J57DRAFT_1231707 [Mycena rebaudengoi]|nr:hypothetical protein C8J57DRAFT_1231707 [Mycena rebaudengoi]